MKTITRTKRWLIALVMILAAGSLALGGLLYAQGFWDEAKAVHITADAIEPSTLAIGTHLIHLSALTDSIYEIANQSAEESGQNTIYYKSELGGGAWFDITSATSLADITEQGTAVQNADIEALFFTHHTKADKVTYDLRTGRAVNMTTTWASSFSNPIRTEIPRISAGSSRFRTSGTQKYLGRSR